MKTKKFTFRNFETETISKKELKVIRGGDGVDVDPNKNNGNGNPVSAPTPVPNP